MLIRPSTRAAIVKAYLSKSYVGFQNPSERLTFKVSTKWK
jgi:hypothetical protein